jgi:hypothetical protein
MDAERKWLILPMCRRVLRRTVCTGDQHRADRRRFGLPVAGDRHNRTLSLIERLSSTAAGNGKEECRISQSSGGVFDHATTDPPDGIVSWKAVAADNRHTSWSA